MPALDADEDRGDSADRLRFAAATGKVDTVRALINAGADVNATTNVGRSHGLTVLHFAVRVGLGSEITATDGDGACALRSAAVSGHAAVVRTLLAAGADVKRADDDNSTPLHAARRADIALMLLDHGADPNIQDRSGATPLHITTMQGNYATAEVLLVNGADVRIMDGNQRTCFHLAHVHDRMDIVPLLVKHGAEAQ